MINVIERDTITGSPLFYPLKVSFTPHFASSHPPHENSSDYFTIKPF